MIKQAPVIIITNRQDEVLLLQRTHEHPLFADEWCLPGGKREFFTYETRFLGDDRFSYSETLEECIFRECIEELDYKIYAFKNTNITLMDEHYQMTVFIALSHDIVPQRKFPNREHLQYAWFAKHQLPEKLSNVTRELLENFDF